MLNIWPIHESFGKDNVTRVVILTMLNQAPTTSKESLLMLDICEAFVAVSDPQVLVVPMLLRPSSDTAPVSDGSIQTFACNFPHCAAATLSDVSVRKTFPM